MKLHKFQHAYRNLLVHYKIITTISSHKLSFRFSNFSLIHEIHLSFLPLPIGFLFLHACWINTEPQSLPFIRLQNIHLLTFRCLPFFLRHLLTFDMPSDKCTCCLHLSLTHSQSWASGKTSSPLLDYVLNSTTSFTDPQITLFHSSSIYAPFDLFQLPPLKRLYAFTQFTATTPKYPAVSVHIVYIQTCLLCLKLFHCRHPAQRNIHTIVYICTWKPTVLHA